MQPLSRRRSLFVRALLACCFAACSHPTSAAQPAIPPPIDLRLVLVDLVGMAPSLPIGALEEVQALLEPVGVRVNAEVALPADERATGGVHVTCLPFDPSRGRQQPTGGVARADQEGQVTVWAFPPRVAQVVGLDLDRFGRWTNRALAVVIVHELAHALAGASHRPSGLMIPQQRRAQLLDSRLAVDRDLHAPIRAGAARLGAAASASPKAASAR